MTKGQRAMVERKVARIEETLTFIRTQYTADEKVAATDFVMDLEGQRAYLLAGLEG